MGEEVATVPTGKKEPEILQDSSLILLARHIAQDKMDYLEFGMRLNIPTTTLVNIVNSVSNKEIVDEKLKKTVAEKSVLLWKERTKEVKTRERIKVIEHALRAMDKNDLADTFLERHSQNQELTADCFQ
ncbi:uncharacterized protein LOC121368108 [Gigantopelta aegis]|uniref:uncharacterized protein LOC121368108 n=1 Tax=Gigantopelta aegis TaxID=1735272 RepID=UPI001B887626|nr:uncharacterized protein LOC121368108 [Gigantopelta aegis]